MPEFGILINLPVQLYYDRQAQYAAFNDAQVLFLFLQNPLSAFAALRTKSSFCASYLVSGCLLEEVMLASRDDVFLKSLFLVEHVIFAQLNLWQT